MAAHQGAMTLVQDAKGGDSTAFEILLDPLLEPGYRLACGMLHDHFAAEDAVQEAALKAWRKLSQLREGTEMRPWFLGIVANECRSTRRSKWWSVVKSHLPQGTEEESSEAVLDGLELRRALMAMDERKRLVLVLHWYLDLSLEEIAVATGSNLRAAESRLQRGIRELRRRMEDQRGYRS
jgi:RNA polymerase sigma factor (sigma-70 family)